MPFFSATWFKRLFYSESMPTTAAEYVARHEIPVAEVRTDIERATRPRIVGPDFPNPPFPVALAGPVQKGFGRGGKDLGCPTGVPTPLDCSPSICF
jgi:hypothetical protein